LLITILASMYFYPQQTTHAICRTGKAIKGGEWEPIGFFSPNSLKINTLLQLR
jgi:hypothetical protein